MLIYTRAFNAAIGQMEQTSVEVDVNFRSAVATIADLPTSNNTANDARMTLDTDHLFVYVNGAWVDQGVYDIADLIQQSLMQQLS